MSETTTILERPAAVKQLLCSSAKTLRHLISMNFSDGALESVAEKLEYLMSKLVVSEEV